MALAAYRSLLRAARVAFQGDAPVLAAAHGRIRAEFGRRASLGPADARAAIRLADDVARILRENVVQGRRAGADTYRLRIHEHTERGDNARG